MSTPERDEDGPASGKRRKVTRACDYCRRKKIKCDGPQREDNRCTKCVRRGAQCTYEEPLYKDYYPASYVENLESRLKRMENLLAQHKPVMQNTNEPDDSQVSSVVQGSMQDPGPSSARSSFRRIRTSLLRDGNSSPESSRSATPESLEEEVGFESSDGESKLEGDVRLADSFSRLSVHPMTFRYHGKSSGLLMIRAAKALVENVTGVVERTPVAQRDSNNTLLPVPRPMPTNMWLRRRIQDSISPFKEFPPQVLMDDLVDLFFAKTNLFTPLLHEPTFRHSIRQGLHLHHGGFGATVLLVCAIGSRYSTDPRIRPDGTDLSQTAGWKWFQQVEQAHKSILAPPQLHDVQIHALSAMFLTGTKVPQSTWVHIGTGIRKAVDVGAHRKRKYGTKPTVTDELWKRAFWCLVTMDWIVGYSLGKPACIYDEDMDLPLLIECDDEHWTDPDGKPVFQQPPNQPSRLAYFNCFIRLAQIIAFAARTIYSTGKSRLQQGNGNQHWEQNVVAELDGALKKWVDAVPLHLKWDPDREDTVFLKQSATLFAHYYQFQIAVHRPFLTARLESPLSLPSLIVCTHAARSCIRLLDRVNQRLGSPVDMNLACIFVSAVTLLINVWNEKRTGRVGSRTEQDLAHVNTALELIQTIARTQRAAGRIHELLLDLAAVAPSSQTQPQTWEEGSPVPAPSSSAVTAAYGQTLLSQPDSGTSNFNAPPALTLASTECLNLAFHGDDDYAMPSSSLLSAIPPEEAQFATLMNAFTLPPASAWEYSGLANTSQPFQSGFEPQDASLYTGPAQYYNDHGFMPPASEGMAYGLEPLGFSQPAALHAHEPWVPDPEESSSNQMLQGEAPGHEADFMLFNDTMTMWPRDSLPSWDHMNFMENMNEQG